mmetsp:Transcript_9410/g.30067  ORF Transcript_9410/g.30067 Transcript_9410/m.30067 type:complete len:306 (-) Transcript_9410:269-1186(-)
MVRPLQDARPEAEASREGARRVRGRRGRGRRRAERPRPVDVLRHPRLSDAQVRQGRFESVQVGDRLQRTSRGGRHRRLVQGAGDQGGRRPGRAGRGEEVLGIVHVSRPGGARRQARASSRRRQGRGAGVVQRAARLARGDPGEGRRGRDEEADRGSEEGDEDRECEGGARRRRAAHRRGPGRVEDAAVCVGLLRRRRDKSRLRRERAGQIISRQKEFVEIYVRSARARPKNRQKGARLLGTDRRDLGGRAGVPKTGLRPRGGGAEAAEVVARRFQIEIALVVLLQGKLRRRHRSRRAPRHPRRHF